MSSPSILQSAQTKLLTGIPRRGIHPFPLSELPRDRNDNLWEAIRSEYGLALVEISALKNFVFSPPDGIAGDESSKALPALVAVAAFDGSGVSDGVLKKKRGRPRKDKSAAVGGVGGDEGPPKKDRKKDTNKDQYQTIRSALLKFKEINGHMLVPYEFRVPVEGHADRHLWAEFEGNLWLGKVCRNIRAEHCYIHWKEELVALGFDYSKQPKGDWYRLHKALLRFKEIHSNLQIGYSFVVPESEEWSQELWGVKLGKALRNIRSGKNYREHRSVLEALGIVCRKPEDDAAAAAAAAPPPPAAASSSSSSASSSSSVAGRKQGEKASKKVAGAGAGAGMEPGQMALFDDAAVAGFLVAQHAAAAAAVPVSAPVALLPVPLADPLPLPLQMPLSLQMSRPLPIGGGNSSSSSSGSTSILGAGTAVDQTLVPKKRKRGEKQASDH